MLVLALGWVAVGLVVGTVALALAPRLAALRQR